MIKKRYIKTNEKLFKFINNEKHEIVNIRIIKNFKGLRKIPVISSYCVYYKDII